LRALLEHTEGWAAGLRLCASALQGRTDPDGVVATISGGDTTFAEYFVGEVLRVQPPEVRRFLLETSVLETFTPELAEAVTQRTDARRILATLTRENAFVQPVGAGTGRYRYHRLFGELLRAQLTWEELDLVPVLHLRACAWLAGQGAVVEAASHAVWAGEWPEAAAVVVADYATGRLMIDGAHGRLGGVFRALPDSADSPELAIVRAALAVAEGRGDLAAERLARADRLIEQDGIGCDDALRLAGCWSRSTRRWRPTRRRATRSRRPRPCWPSRPRSTACGTRSWRCCCWPRRRPRRAGRARSTRRRRASPRRSGRPAPAASRSRSSVWGGWR